MSMENPPPPALIRIPVRIVVLVVVLPVRVVWDVLTATARLLDRTVLRPTGRGLGWVLSGVGAGARFLGNALFVWPWLGLWRYVVVPGCRYGIAVPSVWLYRRVLVPLGRGVLFLLEKLVLVPLAALFRYVLAPLFRYGVVVPVRWFDRYVLTPVGEGLGWFLPRFGRILAGVLFVWPWVGLWRYVLVPVVVYGLVRPLGWLWNRVLAPVGREVRDALALCWRAAGFVSRAVGRVLARLARILVVVPVVWVWVSVVRPTGRWVRDTVRPAARWVRDSLWAPARRVAVETGRAAKDALAAARAAVRQARRDTWRALGGAARTDRPGEPEVARARTLGSTTNVPGAAPAPEISPRKRG
ncbi:hypothetical protein ABT034_01345 [Streptomyces sp. NPDC002773]|uniref:hypothetical protein n=1 Tax=Streptomyces sp. NPDC002773 TaxID=3154430 RepID=UPI00331EC763